MLAKRFEKPPSFVLIRIYAHKWNVTYVCVEYDLFVEYNLCVE